uniref:Uncharacterized protein n=1 Tax=Romanomermis culicivorax TaxID=13658 RepID=A0A915J091_ROMCU
MEQIVKSLKRSARKLNPIGKYNTILRKTTDGYLQMNYVPSIAFRSEPKFRLSVPFRRKRMRPITLVKGHLYLPFPTERNKTDCNRRNVGSERNAIDGARFCWELHGRSFFAKLYYTFPPKVRDIESKLDLLIDFHNPTYNHKNFGQFPTTSCQPPGGNSNNGNRSKLTATGPMSSSSLLFNKEVKKSQVSMRRALLTKRSSELNVLHSNKNDANNEDVGKNEVGQTSVMKLWSEGAGPAMVRETSLGSPKCYLTVERTDLHNVTPGDTESESPKGDDDSDDNCFLLDSDATVASSHI